MTTQKIKASLVVTTAISISFFIGTFILLLVVEKERKNAYDVIDQFIQKNEQLQIEKDSIDDIRFQYLDSLQQIRSTQVYFETIILKFDSILIAIPKKYEKQRNIISTGNIDGTIGILSNY